MTDWAGLSWSQKASSIFMLLFAALLVAVPVLQALLDPPAFRLTFFFNGIAIASAIAALVLNTKNIRGDARALLWRNTPKASRVLFIVAASSLFVGNLVGMFANVFGAA